MKDTYPQKKDLAGVEVRKEVLIGIQAIADQMKINQFQLSKDNLEKEWSPLQDLIDYFNLIEGLINGASLLQKIGAEVAKNAKWPDTVRSPIAALESINVAYHMNHRRDGKELFDHQQSKIIEGYIGHDYLEIDHEKKVVNFICGSFYPSDFDLGMAKEVLKIFGGSSIAALSVKRDESKPSRKNGGDTCTFNLKYALLRV